MIRIMFVPAFSASTSTVRTAPGSIEAPAVAQGRLK
eukprot:CAMPEP_0197692352 /NCGR_PEP_ID=MMETSP1338-20131121/110953_1 /TAXON_ID=43686 ORGANISM="Pelagodinium beii, Strain RCC1491" /NCGR_SAMPLE_ID=MMETSP1338 /ASSEMBLY_ACC=CAM_ASM_000754 /LENGTH=35 /DNA_ID= /DNA_START= /DNA_END= /DNA_ORIENTATION=